MEEIKVNTQELAAKKAFSRQSVVFDALYTSNPIIQYKRKRVRSLVLQFLQPGMQILELNAGTGEDAVFFARLGYRVHATDISSGMLEVLERKALQAGLQDRVSTEACSFTGLNGLKSKGPYDLIFSNFAGLNCTAQLNQVLNTFSSLLKPGGRVILTVMPGFCLWESLLALKGQFKIAFRRSFSRNGAPAHIEGVPFRCWYYPPGYIGKHLGPSFQTLRLEGLCTLVPPSFLEFFPVRYPRLYSWLVRLEEKWKGSWPWKYIGDYYIMALEQKPAQTGVIPDTF